MHRIYFAMLLAMLLIGGSTMAQNTISGRVTDDTAMGLPGVNVMIGGSTQGTVTDVEGKYSLSAPKTGTLVYSFIGYEKQEVAIDNRTVIDIELKESLTKLHEVVVVGYGSQKKSDVTGAVAVIGTKDFANQPVTRFDQVLQGRAAGVQVMQSNGAPGGTSKIRVRGANSILGDNDPLYVIDGFIGANYNLLNPDDIATIQVLKDAASTSIYGSRGANGVIIITTKSGNKGIKVNYEGQVGVSQVIKTYDVLSAGDYADLANTRAQATGTGLPFSQDQIDAFYKNGGTNWQDLIYRTGSSQQHMASVSGGDEKTHFLISGNYLNQKGIVANSGFKRFLLRSNVRTDITKNLSVRLNMYGAKTTNHNTNGGGGLTEALAWAPTTPAYGTDGNPTTNDPVGSVGRNPLDYLFDQDNDAEVANFNAVGGINYKLPIDGLSLDLQVGMNYLDSQSKFLFGPRISLNNPYGQRGSNNQFMLQNSNSLNYTKELGDHRITAVAVFETQQVKGRSFSAKGNGLVFPQLGYDNIGANANSTVASSFNKTTLLSLLGRVNYAYKDKYLLTAAVRRDGSSKFANGNQYSVFPSVALGWRLSEENFIKSLNVFSNLKLRGSWGMTGSQAIGAYATLSPFNTIQMAFNNTGVASGIMLGNQGNTNLKWETTNQTDGGIEMGFLNGRIRAEIDYFHKYTHNLLLNYTLPLYAGGGQQARNVGSVVNKGFEFTLGATPIDHDKFRWETNVNFSTLKNKVVSLGDRQRISAGTNVGGGMSTTSEFMMEPGQPLGSYWGLQYNGTFKPDQADLAAKQGRFPGDANYQDLNGDNYINTNDFQIIGHSIPRFTGGWNNTVDYGRFTLNVFFQGVFGVDKLNYTRAVAMSGSGGARQFVLSDIKDYYRTGNETSDIPAFSKTYQPFTQSSRFVENGSYLRLKNISLSYNMPSGWLKDRGTARLFASATNVLTFTKYTGPDPESSSVVSGNNDNASGIDFGSYPNAKVYTLGVNISF